MAELVLGEGIKEIRLVLGPILALLQMIGNPVSCADDTTVVACGEEIGSQSRCPPQQDVKFDVLVTTDAGVGSATAPVFGAKIANDRFLELSAKIDDQMGKTEFRRHLVRILDRSPSTAAAKFCRPTKVGRKRKEAHCHADDLISLIQKKRGGHRGIHPTAHGDNDSL